MSGYEEYFEAPTHWGRTYDDVTPGERLRIDALVELLPADAGAVLDAGCGDGVVTNILFDRGIPVTGADISAEALRHVRAPTVQASTTELPFPDRSFGCVVAANVLEHLPHGMFETTISELARVADRYLLLSFPDREDLTLAQTRCTRCKTVFHPARHVRSIDETAAVAWFPEFGLVEARRTGEHWPYRSRKVQRLAQLVGDTWYRIPEARCPGCGYPVEPPRPNQVVRAANGGLQRVLAMTRPGRPSQLVVLLDRVGHQLAVTGRKPG